MVGQFVGLAGAICPTEGTGAGAPTIVTAVADDEKFIAFRKKFPRKIPGAKVTF